MTYEEAREEAQRKADETGCDYGLFGPDHSGGWQVRGLPSKHHRFGDERRVEVAMCSDLDRCWKGHGPMASWDPPRKYYHDEVLGVVGVEPGHESGEYTRLSHRTPRHTWIRTADLHETEEAARAAEPAKWLRDH